MAAFEALSAIAGFLVGGSLFGWKSESHLKTFS
jgi:hypothetical protein